MSIVGVGTDIVEVARFASCTDAFMARVYTEEERQYLSGKRPESAAGLFAAKEAVAKALGTGFLGFGPAAVEIVHNAQGKPEVRLHGKAAEIAKDTGITRIYVSISHCGEYAVAMAVCNI